MTRWKRLNGLPLAGLALGALAALPAAQVDGQQKISALEGGITVGLDDGDQFGSGMASPGDLNGDGFDELVVGTPNDDGQGPNRGGVWVLFTNDDGTVASWQRINATQGNLQGPLDDADQFGSAVASLGDLDGDGVGDIAVGAWKDDDGFNNAGAVYILFLETSGRVKAEQKISASVGGFAGSLAPGDAFGLALAAVGDLDGDGVTELAVGAPQADDGGADRGALWILFLQTDGTVKGTQKISGLTGNFVGTLDDLDRFGGSLAGIDDLDGDLIPDLAVGAEGDDDGGSNRGAVWVLFMAADGMVKDHAKISSTSGDFEGDLANADRFGGALAYMGALEQGPWPVLAVGAYQDDSGGTDRGAVWLLSLEPDGEVVLHRKIAQGVGGFGGSLSNGDLMGKSLARLGDLDGDGFDEIVAGVPRDDDGGADTGAAWVLFPGDLANVRLRLGAGLNNQCFFSVNLPVLGTVWLGSVLTIQQPGAVSTFIIFTTGPLDPGFPFFGGELLVDPTTGLVASSSRPAVGGATIHPIPVTSDLSLAGLTLYAQAGVIGGGPLQACNALDVTLGF